MKFNHELTITDNGICQAVEVVVVEEFPAAKEATGNSSSFVVFVETYFIATV